MIRGFADAGTEDIFNQAASKRARKTCPQTLWRIAQRKLDQIHHITSLRDLGFPPGNMLEALSGSRRGQHSIRINQQYRICFRWVEGGAEDVEDVEIVDYHR